MKKIILVYGLIAGAIVAAMMLVTMPLYEKGTLNQDYGELLGYTTMVVALSLVFFGIKSYRDNHQNGKITFLKGLQIGLLITVVASLIYALTWEYSYHSMAPEYVKKMSEHYFEKMKERGATAADIQKAREQYDLYNQNFLLRFCITAFVEMFPVGLVVSLVSAGLLRKKDFLPTSTNNS